MPTGVLWGGVLGQNGRTEFNLTFVNNTCLTFSGDVNVYSYQLDQAAGRQAAAGRGGEAKEKKKN